jgi:hypothetical protein
MTHIRTDNGAVIVKLQDELAKANAEIARLREGLLDINVINEIVYHSSEMDNVIRQALAQREQK